MKQLKLTTKHKSRIIQICKILYNKYDIKFNGDKIQYVSKKSSNFAEEIHYSEFTWRLLNKLCEVYIKSPIKSAKMAELYGMVWFNQSEHNHPVDYLYQEFNHIIYGE